MRLHPNWRGILRHAWSVRINLLLAVTSGADAAVSYVADGKPSAALLVFGVSVSASISRIVAQDNLR